MSISATVRRRVRQDAGDRCGYCLSQQRYLPYSLEIEHIVPTSRGGTDDADNLWLACRACNMYKSNQTIAPDPTTGLNTPLFHPRQHKWRDHFRWSADGPRIEGITAIGRATVPALKLNNLFAITARQNWIIAGWHPPTL